MSKVRFFGLMLCLLVFAVPVFAQDAPPTVSLGGNDQLGEFLVGPDGMTLYMFARDSAGTSACYERCAEIWNPLIVPNADALMAGDGLPGELGTIERTTGSMQVTYNGMPLYFWYLDYAAGEAKGNRVGGNWWVVPPATVYIEQDDELGSVLVGPTGMTLYMFTNDAEGVSNCVDQCAANWPPLTVESADDVVAGVNLSGELTTIERADGTLQVAYNGMPLYYWKDDAARGDATGEGVGDVWFTVVPETVSLSADGSALVSGTGMTLYTSSGDEMGVSNCGEECLQSWTPYTLAGTERLMAGAGVMGELGSITLENGQQIVTYNGWPLYTSRADRAPGDMNGVGTDEAWMAAAP